MEKTEKYWVDLCSRHTNKNLAINKWFKLLVKAYGEKHRHYHTLKHITSIIEETMDRSSNISDKDSILFAAWFHDIVYNPKKKDNENESAVLAGKALLELDIHAKKIETVKELINATAKHVVNKSEPDSDLSFFLDCDLKILGSASPDYLTYAQQIREEYHHVPSFIYNHERKKVLKKFLESSTLYRTEYFKNKYETQARNNISQEIQTL